MFLCAVRADLGGVDCCQAVGQCGTCVEGFFHVSAPLLGPAKELCTMRSVQVLGTLFLQRMSKPSKFLTHTCNACIHGDEIGSDLHP